jgi:hypothetical protein
MLASDSMVKAYAEQGLVQPVLAGWRGPDYDFNAVFPRGQVQSPKVRAFVDFLAERLNLDADYMRVLCEDSKRCEHLVKAAAAAEAAAVANAESAANSELQRVLPRRSSRPRVAMDSPA